MCDKLVYDLAQEIEGSPNVFVRKDWINILDNQTQNYQSNQSIIDTSQLSNSNKYMSYREAYLSIPFLITLATTGPPVVVNAPAAIANLEIRPDINLGSLDYSVGLKNWFGQIIHSFTLDYNGTTIVQQTPYVNMWNSFKLMTSLSYGDIITQGATIGFYPDSALSFSVFAGGTTSSSGFGVTNNINDIAPTFVTGQLNSFDRLSGNEGFVKRQQMINFDGDATVGSGTYESLLFGGTTQALRDSWKTYISTKQGQVLAAGPAQITAAVIQYSVVATVYLKHVHSFFNMCPLLKGAFMKMTMNLNNTTTTFSTSSSGVSPAPLTAGSYVIAGTTVANPLGGVNPLMLSSGLLTSGGRGLFSGVPGGAVGNAPGASSAVQPYRMNLSVGYRCLDQQLSVIPGVTTGQLSSSVYLYIPAYTFNPTFESAYLSSPVKQIKYTDVYQYQVLNIDSGNTFNNLITNGIANIKSVLILPFYSTSDNPFINGVPVWQSPFDPAGTGPTSPLCMLTNFNIQISGQNAIYNTQLRSFEQFNNQLYGQNAVNGGLTDGITSGLIDRQSFDMEYCYYYVNVERMLPVEQSVPKSVQIVGRNLSAFRLDLIVFVEYGCEIAIDILSGARV